ncbi:antibiotic biosynthesis monooxygenase family protein [Candidatus Poriferisodalis sp.]|uniref:antibiotic biosynthesis monooxygenase family protein n=1 Tax=Candidatus Poriferisodalis sp. TaxID=3101277 RepID=UPI003B02ACCC
MIRTVLALKPKPGMTDAVVELFDEEGIVERALTVEGCLGVEVWAGPDDVLVMGTWVDPEAYQAWLEHPQRNATNDVLNELLNVPITAHSHGGSYALALSGGQFTEGLS